METTAANVNPVVRKLSDFILLEQKIRGAANVDEFAFTVCNCIHDLVKYDSALFLKRESNGKQTVCCISGISDFNPSAPIVLLCENLVNAKNVFFEQTTIHSAEHLPQPLRQEMQSLKLEQLACMSLTDTATIVFVRFNKWTLPELHHLQQITEVTDHAWSALTKTRKEKKLHQGLISASIAKYLVLGLLATSMLLPVRQSVIANGQITDIDPTVIASGLNAVIQKIHVIPNQILKKGQLLVSFDRTELESRYSTISEELKLAEEKYRKARQQSLSSVQGASFQFAELQSAIQQKNIELTHINDMVERLDIVAPSDGVAVFSRVQDWEGRAVATGEKILQISDPDKQQFEIWLSSSDAISLPEKAPVKFFPDAFPLQSVDGEVVSMSFFPIEREAKALAFRVIASIAPNNHKSRLGMNGTARLYGERVLLGYYLFRKPLSTARRWLGV